MSNNNISHDIASLIYTVDPDNQMHARRLGREIAQVFINRPTRPDVREVVAFVARVNASKTMNPDVLAAAIVDYFGLDKANN